MLIGNEEVICMLTFANMRWLIINKPCLREAEVREGRPAGRVEIHDKFSGRYFWYEALSLPIPFYDVLHANVSQVADV